MSNLDALTIGELKQLIAAIGGSNHAPVSKDESLGWNIVVLDRGFVYVGNVRTEGDWLIIDDAQNIRRWGTSGKGLGALKDGPLPETMLDKCPTIRAYRSVVKHLLAVDGAKWSK